MFITKDHLENKWEILFIKKNRKLDEQLPALLKERSNVLTNELEKISDLWNLALFGNYSGFEDSMIKLRETHKPSERMNGRTGYGTYKKTQRQIPKQIPVVKKYTQKHGLYVLITIVIVFFAATALVHYDEIDTIYEDEPSKFKTKYVIENLRGDVIYTSISWKISQSEPLHVAVVNSADVSADMLDTVKNAILSDKVVEINDALMHKGSKEYSSTYYLGWSGALKMAAENPTEFNMPTDLEIIESNHGEGDIFVTLTKLRDSDGNSAYTTSLVDENNNQILKSQITIYEADRLEKKELAALVRHEFGHALGLAHSTAPEDLMAPVIQTDYPYISECDIDAMVFLYDGGESNKVVCEK